MTKKTVSFIYALILLIMFSGCVQEDRENLTNNITQIPELTPTETIVDREYIRGNATVEEIQTMILESFPVQINVVAKGYLPDGCTGIDRIIKNRDENTFFVTITTVRPADAVCTQSIVPFEEVISLDVYGLEAGKYVVFVNEASSSFTLATDNIIPAD